MPHARVAIFWHIPWPNPEAFSICPWQQELLDGLLGADLIGFHIQAHCNNFLETVDRTLESRVDWEHFAVKRSEPLVLRAARFPSASICSPPRTERRITTPTDRAALLNELGVEATFLGSASIASTTPRASSNASAPSSRFLERYPRYQGKFTFVQIGAPSRSHIQRYADFQRDVEDEAQRINDRFRNGRWRPIVMLSRQHSHAEVQRYYRAAHFCMVTSLHDGMNLVAKEYIAARDDEHGVLILSSFTGAARDLRDAIIVNPYDVDGTANAIARALEMSSGEVSDRMRSMRRAVTEHNIYWWAGSLIGDLCDLRLNRV